MEILTGENTPKPFNRNDVLAWTGRVLRDMCRESRECFYPSEFILNEELQEADAYDNPEEKERALSDENNVYHTFARFCLQELSVRKIVWGKTVRDLADNMEYETYCKTDLLKSLCPQIMAVGLPDIDVILDQYNR
jgi:hypothetical protein